MELARIKRPINRSAIARQNPCGCATPPVQNPVSVVGGGATVGSGGTGAGIAPSPGNQFSNTRFFFNNWSPYYWGYSPWWNYYGCGAYGCGGGPGWPIGFGYGSPWYWPQWPTTYGQPYWPGPYAYGGYGYGQPRYPVVAVA